MITFLEWLKKITEAGGPFDPKMTDEKLQKGGAGGWWGAPKTVGKAKKKHRKKRHAKLSVKGKTAKSAKKIETKKKK